MSSTATDYPYPSRPHDSKPPTTNTTLMDPEKHTSHNAPTYRSTPSIKSVRDSTHRKLKPRHIQLIGIGGTIGTALCTFILAVTLCMAELVSYLPISSPFIRFAGRYVDEAFGFAAGWNFFIFEAALVPFEIVALKWYGETEFWAALGKVLLIIGLIIFTFVSMLGGNPLHDRYGFRYWRSPGAFAPLYRPASLGRFLGFLQCLIQASFTIAGPDYVSMAAGEAENPRKIMPRAYKAVFYRLTAFFVLGSLCVGINVPYDDPELKAAFKEGKPGAAASPYMMIFIFPVLYGGWKIIKKTKQKKPHEVDLQEDLEEIEEYTRNFVEVDDQNAFNKWMDKIFG
ncbi:hypothetical protein GRF29_106g189048 [Pseudopithomyces chartarum]|uniref:Amino acid permease/ SLC12A domain-containing protein n=1 Tax=Pseudopithomyces chartarum TaxID=1892770 RepID=A0AAN6LWQ7_9PLEO|nr:hypothetical protein GRF29_106g189048 [Pseudopithomyces chartarum]